MNNIKEILEKYNFKVNSIEYKNKIIILNTTSGKYVYKNNNNYKIYEYLISRGFNNFPKVLTDKNEDYEITEFINEQDIPKELKVNDLINLMSFLHKKTFFYKEIDLDDLKKMYETMQNDANYLMSYYNDLNQIIDNTTYMSPTQYLLVRNIDIFYYLITFVKLESVNWYNQIKNKKMIRLAMVHGNLNTNHIIVNDSSYIISWNKASVNLPYIDIKSVFEENYNYLNFQSVLNDYIKDNKLDNNEYLFLLINLAIPKKIEFTNNTFLDCYNLSNYIEYLKKIALVIQKYDKMIHKS